jgi:signal peptidase I
MGTKRKVWLYGDSMLPNLQSGNAVIIESIKDAKTETKIGDIVSYKSKGFDRNGKHRWYHNLSLNYTCHRIIGKTPTCALIKGDNREYVEKVFYDKINGIVRLPPLPYLRNTKKYSENIK